MICVLYYIYIGLLIYADIIYSRYLLWHEWQTMSFDSKRTWLKFVLIFRLWIMLCVNMVYRCPWVPSICCGGLNANFNIPGHLITSKIWGTMHDCKCNFLFLFFFSAGHFSADPAGRETRGGRFSRGGEGSWGEGGRRGQAPPRPGCGLPRTGLHHIEYRLFVCLFVCLHSFIC